MTPDELQPVIARLRRAGCVFAEDEARLLLEAAAGDVDALDDLVARRCAGEPLEVVVGFAEFAGLRIAVDPGVFVPRQRTVRLVRRAAEHVGALPRSDRVALDLGCGTGALAAALLDVVECEMYAVDSSVRAVACAARNLGDRATVLRGDLFAPLPARLRGQIRVVLANLPYVPTDAVATMPREARLHEPLGTLDGGPDGMRPLNKALAQAGSWMHHDGIYLGELHERQVRVATELAERYGFQTSAVVDPEDRTAIASFSRLST